MNNDINVRVSNYYNSNPDKQKYIVGVTQSDVPKVVLKNGDLQAYATIDELENNTFNWSQIIPQNTNSNMNQTVVTPIQPEPVVSSPTPEPVVQSQPVNTSINNAQQQPIQNTNINQPVTPPIQPESVTQPTNIPLNNAQQQPIQNTNINGNTTLNDVKTLFDLSLNDSTSKNTLDNILRSFALNQNGVIDINMAINKVQNNSLELVVDSIINNKGLPTELYKYTPEGKLISQDDIYPFTSVDTEIDKAFNNVLIFANGAKVYGINNFTNEIITSAKTAFTNLVNNKLIARGYNLNQNVNNNLNMESTMPTSSTPAPEIPQNNNDPLIKTLTPPVDVPEVTEEKAGFADIFILFLIVAVYAVIIVNLVLKLR